MKFPGLPGKKTRKVREVSSWYCSCGNPRGFEAAVFRARGLVPLQPIQTYQALAIGDQNPTKLRAAKKDPLLRKSVVADKMLRESNPS